MKKGRRNLLLQVCRCWRSDRENEREQRRKEGHTGDPSLCTDLPLLLLYPTLVSIGVARSWCPLLPLFCIARASLRLDKFSHIFEKIHCTDHKGITRRPDRSSATRCIGFWNCFFARHCEAGPAGFYTGIFVQSRSFRRLWPVFVCHGYFSRYRSEREISEFSRDVKSSITIISV